MIANVKGTFRKFDAAVVTEGGGFSGASIAATADAASIDTNNADRDNHLRSADFFDAENNRLLRFEGATVRTPEGGYQMRGDLTIRGVSRPVTFDVEFGGMTKDPYGNEKAGFSFSGTINRKDWGLNWNAALEAGGVMVSEEVRIAGEIQLVKDK